MPAISKRYVQYSLIIVVGLGLTLLNTSIAASDRANSTVTVTKTVPCIGHSSVVQMQTEYGQPGLVKWARVQNGQMSAFIWQSGVTDNEELTVFTYLADGGSCQLAQPDKFTLDWVVINS